MSDQNIKIQPGMLLGLDESHLVVETDFDCKLAAAVVAPLRRLCDEARAAGFDIAVASSFRNFYRQLAIWNDKAAGLRPVLDDEGRSIDIATLADLQKVTAILRWSALPGASRHHWGTDLDVYDRAGVGPEYRVQLTLDECTGTGPFADFHRWLDERIAAHQAHGFYRPYGVDRGGVAPEPWHLSYQPLARQCAQCHNITLLAEQLAATPLALKETILNHLPELYQRFVVVPH